MTWTMIATTLPLLGAGITLALRRYPRVHLITALLFVSATGLAWAAGETAFRAPAWLLIGGAFLAVLGLPLHREAPRSISLTLLLLGLCLGALSEAALARLSFTVSAMGIVGMSLYRPARTEGALTRGPAVVIGIGLLALVGSSAVPDLGRDLLVLAACAVMLPLFPLQSGYICAITMLPRGLAAFLAIAFPILGWQTLASLAHPIPAALQGIVLVLALAGALSGFIRALVHPHLARVLASTGTILFSMAWWHWAAIGRPQAETALYLGAAALAISGLLLAGHQVEARYGVLDLDKLRGLARTMPRFSLLAGLLMMAGMGLPLFGLFSGFMTIFTDAAATAPSSGAIILLIWFLVSWLLAHLMQRLLFGTPRPDLIYTDLGSAECLSLALVLLILVLAGIAPGALFQPASPAAGGSFIHALIYHTR